MLSLLALLSSCKQLSSAPTPPSEQKLITPSTPEAVNAANNTDTSTAATPQKNLQTQRDSDEVFNLIDNRLLAHQHLSGGLFMPADHSFTKYIHFNRPRRSWQLGQSNDSQPHAVLIRPSGSLMVPLQFVDTSSPLVLSLYVYSPSAQTAKIYVGNTALDSHRVTQGWQQLDVPLPSELIKPSETRLGIGFSKKGSIPGRSGSAYAALKWAYIGPSGTKISPESGTLVKKTGFSIEKNSAITQLIYPYPGSTLKLNASSSDPTCKLELDLNAVGNGNSGKKSLNKKVSGAISLDLSPVEDKLAKLHISTTCTTPVTVTQLSITRTRTQTMPAPTVETAPKHVLFWLIDNARTDRYTLYNPKTRVKTPVITKLGNDGVVFDNAYISGTESRVSHATIWTGMYPKQHRFLKGTSVIQSKLITLGEAMRDTGLNSVAWTSNGNISKKWGFGQGGSVFKNHLHIHRRLDAESLANQAISFIKENYQDPFFVYLGTIDAHVTWRSHQPWLKQYHPEPYSGPFMKNVPGPMWDKAAANPTAVSKSDRKRALAIYDSTISFNDQQLGRVLDTLDELGIREDTMIVITADHGEELWEHGRIGHGATLRDTVVGVPYLINYPKLFKAGTRIREGVDVASLLPTMIAARAKKVPRSMQAAPVIDLAQGRDGGYPSPSIATQYEVSHVIRSEEYKLWIGSKGEPKLFLPKLRPERNSAANEFPNAVRWLTDGLSFFLEHQSHWRQSDWGNVMNHSAVLASDLETGHIPEPINPK